MTTNDETTAACDSELRQLLVWYPTATLSNQERAQVEEHVSQCAQCAELLHFVAQVESTVLADAAAHPSANELVRYTDVSTSMDDHDQVRIGQHLEICAECAREAEILCTVDQDWQARQPRRAGPAAPPIPSEAHVAGSAEERVVMLDRQASPRYTWPRRCFDLAVRPAAAAVYLLAAMVLLVLLVIRPGASDRVETRIDSIVVLSDASVPLRGLPPRKTIIEARYTNRLLLELTNLDHHPGEDDLFVVRIVTDQAEHAAWTAEVRGRDLARDYAMLLTLPAWSLAPGIYTVETVEVSGTNEERVFCSSIDVR
jgi:anti-sigma factor ChrR (cupin superfamily)